jgi:hypothetical protein
MPLSRRTLLRALGAAAAGSSLLRLTRASADPPAPGPHFLIVLAGTGGASILDGPLAIRASESAHASTLNTFPDAMVQGVDGSPFRAVDLQVSSVGAIPAPIRTRPHDFIKKHHGQMVVVTGTGSSVNHAVGQRRSITGNEAWNGRTLQELVALTHGKGLAIPNVHLATGTSFTERGTDASLPSWAYGEPVSDPALWPLALDGVKGQTTPDRALVQRARAVRNEQLDPGSRFARFFGQSPRLAQWQAQRGAPQQAVEGADLISKLMLFPDSARYPLAAHGLASSPVADRVREVFPLYDRDPLEAQAALTFLLLKYRVAATVTLGPGASLVLDADPGGAGAQAGKLPENALKNTPIAFDFAHQSHRATQALMWARLYHIAEGLITLLSQEEFGGGQSLWDRSLIYVATEFGRTKTRPADAPEFGTGHDLNNASLLLSPLLKGDRLIGGLDPDTGLTHGYDPLSGAPDQGREMPEKFLFTGLLDVLGVDTTGSGLPTMTALRG